MRRHPCREAFVGSRSAVAPGDLNAANLSEFDRDGGKLALLVQGGFFFPDCEPMAVAFNLYNSI
jgi:hypothetical protein